MVIYSGFSHKHIGGSFHSLFKCLPEGISLHNIDVSGPLTFHWLFQLVTICDSYHWVGLREIWLKLHLQYFMGKPIVSSIFPMGKHPEFPGFRRVQIFLTQELRIETEEVWVPPTELDIDVPRLTRGRYWRS